MSKEKCEFCGEMHEVEEIIRHGVTYKSCPLVPRKEFASVDVAGFRAQMAQHEGEMFNNLDKKINEQISEQIKYARENFDDFGNKL